MPLRVLPLQYPAAVTGGTCRSLAVHASASSACAGSVRRSGAMFHPLRPVPSQPSAQVRVRLMRTYVLPEWGLLCKASPDVLSPSLLSAIFGNGRTAVSDTPTVAQICRAVNYAGVSFSLSAADHRDQPDRRNYQNDRPHAQLCAVPGLTCLRLFHVGRHSVRPCLLRLFLL